MQHVSLPSLSPTVLMDEGWIEWNKEKWGLRAERFEYEADGRGGAKLVGWLYLNSRGNVCMPGMHPYMPLVFTGTDTGRWSKRYRQWMSVADQFAADLARRGVAGELLMPPGAIDLRPLQWRGFRIGVRYTTALSFPLDFSRFDEDVMKQVRKAQRQGYTVHESADWDLVEHCLGHSERRKRFSHRLCATDLSQLHQRLGRSRFRAFIGYGPAGQPVCAQLRLFAPGSTAIGWAASTQSNHLRSGVNQLTYLEGLRALAADGVTGIDLCGSNIPSVAAAKANWGGPLVPYLTVRQPGARFVRAAIREALAWYRHSWCMRWQ